MKKIAKTSEVLNVYNIIGQAKYTKMSDEDKVKVWKATRKLKPIATKLDEDSKDAAEKLKPEGLDERLVKAQERERLAAAGQETESTMTAEEYDAFIAELRKFNKLVAEAVREFGDKEVEVEFDGLSEDGFGKMMASNDWTMKQAEIVGEFVMESA